MMISSLSDSETIIIFIGSEVQPGWTLCDIYIKHSDNAGISSFFQFFKHFLIKTQLVTRFCEIVYGSQALGGIICTCNSKFFTKIRICKVRQNADSRALFYGFPTHANIKLSITNSTEFN